MSSDLNDYGFGDAEKGFRLKRDIKKDSEKAVSPACGEKDAVPDDMTIIGIAGTAGKSTTVGYIKRFLDDYLRASGQRECAVFSGGEMIGAGENISAGVGSEAFDMRRQLRFAYDEGIRYAVFEISESDLKQERFSGITFNVVALLNIFGDSRDRDTRFSFIEYFNTLLTVFKYGVTAIVNCECVYREGIFEAAGMSCRVLTCGWSRPSDYYAYDIKPAEENGRLPFKLHAEYEDTDFILWTSDLFELQDVLIALTAARQCGVPFESMKNSLEKISGVQNLKNTYFE